MDAEALEALERGRAEVGLGKVSRTEVPVLAVPGGRCVEWVWKVPDGVSKNKTESGWRLCKAVERLRGLGWTDDRDAAFEEAFAFFESRAILAASGAGFSARTGSL